LARSLLLASFAQKAELYDAIDQISEILNINKDSIFTFQNENEEGEYILSYNMNPEYANIKFNTVWKNTISVHRKKQTNTLYSLNAMNEYIKSKNNGVLNKEYQIDWTQFSNSFLIIKGGKLKIIPLRLVKLNQ
jgi:hypothetical protein